MDQETLALLTDLHVGNHRQGPGSDAAFERALMLSGIDTTAPLAIADIGCGTGSATLPLLQKTKATVTTVELIPAFLARLEENAQQAGVADRLTTLEADMGALPFQDERFDVLWAEGAIYNVGFAHGVQAWRRFLRPGGVLVVSELTWLRPEVPEPLRAHWKQEYPEVATAAEKMKVLEDAGYVPIGYFPLAEDAWLTEYYRPLEASFAAFLERQGHSAAAEAIVQAERVEIALYEQYKEFVSYGMYIARRV